MNKNSPSAFSVVFKLILVFLSFALFLLILQLIAHYCFGIGYENLMLLQDTKRATLFFAIESSFYLLSAYLLFGFNFSKLTQLFVCPSGKRPQLLLRWVIDTLLFFLALSALLHITHTPTTDYMVIPTNTFDPISVLPFVLVMSVFVPLSEEILFRGYLQNQLTAIKGAKTAIIVAAFIFGFIHTHFGSIIIEYIAYEYAFIFKANEMEFYPMLMPDFSSSLLLNITILFHKTLAGLFFGYLMWRYQSLWPAVISHGIFNLFAVLTLDYGTLEKSLIYFGMNETALFPYIVLIISAGILVYRVKRNIVPQ